MKHTIEIDFNKSINIEVSGISGWDETNKNRVMIDLTLGNMQLNGMIQEDAERLYRGLDKQLHDETYESLETKYFKALAEIDELRDIIQLREQSKEEYSDSTEMY